MIVAPSSMQFHPDIHLGVETAADMLTGDGVFADTDLVRIPANGWLLVQGTVADNGVDSLVYVPQLNHQENRSNYMVSPVNEPGMNADWTKMIPYKIRVHQGMTPRVLFDKNTATVAYFEGAFFKGVNNPVAMQTPDIVTVWYSATAATTQNILSGTDLEDCPYPGYLLVWASSADGENTLQINQFGHQTGNTSDIPVYNGGLSVDCSSPCYKTYVPATGNPTVTVTIADTDATKVVCAFYVDWKNVSQSQMRRMGL